MKITVWTKVGCPWCDEVIDLLKSRQLAYEERVVTGDRAHWDEMVRISRQSKAPVVDIDGHLLVDTDADAVAAHLARVAG